MTGIVGQFLSSPEHLSERLSLCDRLEALLGFHTFGAWRTVDRRVLEDVRAYAGFLYEFRMPLRGAVGPTVLAVAGYDNQAATPWATGVGPSVLSYLWLGGDKYRSYDAVLTLQLGYIFNVGSDQRPRGWHGQIGLPF